MGLLDRFRRVERRKHQRVRVIETAWARTAEHSFPYVCVLWDLSEGGARIAVASPDALPEEFELLLERDQRVGTSCRVAWRTSEQIGVEFIGGVGPILVLLEQKKLAAVRT